MKKSILTAFEVIRPKYEYEQADLGSWIARAHAEAEGAQYDRETDPVFAQRIDQLITRFGCKPNQIASRGTDLEDVQSKEFDGSGLYSMRAPGRAAFGATIHERSLFFANVANRMFERFYEKAPQPDHMIHVTCTGYVSPSAPQCFVAEHGWTGTTDVTHAYHMGCYASIPSVRMALGFNAAGQKNVDIVHTEMCTLHLNPLDHSPEQLVVQSLFADGHIKYSVRDAASTTTEDQGFEVLQTLEWVIPESGDAMTWIPTEWGMKMTLSRDVPSKIASSLKPFLDSILKKSETGVEALSNAVFAIHPGGPKIIDSIGTLLELRPDQIAHSRGVLRDFGNMSSATLPHVWNRIATDGEIPSGKLVISLAFGPGLTIFGAVMRKL